METTIEKIEEKTTKKRGRPNGSKTVNRTKVEKSKTQRLVNSANADIEKYKKEKRAKKTRKVLDPIYSDKITPIVSSRSKTIVYFMDSKVPLSFRNVPNVNINDILCIKKTPGVMSVIPNIAQVNDIILDGRGLQIGLKVKDLSELPETGDYNTITLKL